MKANDLVQSVKATPPALLLGSWFAGVSINEWAAFAGLIYTLCLIAERIYRWRMAWLDKRAHSRAGE